MKKVLSLVLVLVMLVGLLPRVSLVSNAAKLEPVNAGLAGKKISILGDSISTMGGVSNNTDYNSTIGKNAIYYTGSNYDVTLADTWWKQTIDTLGMELCVSNAWSGSCIFDPTPKASTAYVDRCVQLHNDHTGEEPDIIAVYLGTNDAGSYPDTVGKAADINYDTLIVEDANGYTYADPQTASEAYAIMLHKISQRYPNAEVYCFTIVNRNTFNDTIRTIAKKFGAYVVDLYQKSGLVVSHANDKLFMQGWHPTAQGMDAITSCFLSAIYENSRYVTANTHSITYNLNSTRVDQGTAYAVLSGSAFTCSLSATIDGNDAYPEVTITMGGKDITATCYKDGKITIDEVTGNITIQAKAHNHSYTSVVTNVTCAQDGYTTYTCLCGYSYVDNYVSATEKHNYVDGICTVCGIDGFVVHKQDGVKTYYKTLEEALAVTGGTIQLLTDVTADAVNLNADVTLDLNGYTLTANSIAGKVMDSADGKGLVKVNTKKAALTSGDDQLILWDNTTDNSGYRVFNYSFINMGKNARRDDAKETRAAGKTIQSYWSDLVFTNSHAYTLVASGVSGLEIAFELSWTPEGGEKLSKTFRFGNAVVADWALAEEGNVGNQNYCFYMRVTGFEELTENGTVAIKPMLKTAFNSAETEATENRYTLERPAPGGLVYEYGFGNLNK